MSFSHHLRSLAASIWDNQLTHPFVVALGDGTLPERKFKYYILQDARFLGDLSRVFAAGAVKAPDAESALRFAKLAEETIVVERSLGHPGVCLHRHLLGANLFHPGLGGKTLGSKRQFTLALSLHHAQFVRLVGLVLEVFKQFG